ncbi:polysaccharide pyruvyl transferase family protein [Dysgonomonas sp. BGC7]|uniref:polysaccharide pyruvyl transferase family protein n=1 Tax=Dysgonomonas sp. BGC7 TaxID=1658008 RepID=UPI000682205D|nr:polysaccharide pyruvyl transferase family protein [Dysgonomonas sp. BGC7]MBD8389758.1 hypothetical protein [Dysgonomonas sp. BGC7]
MKYYYIVEGKYRGNLGDVLQGMVAKPFLPQNAIPADREDLASLDKNEQGLLVGNAWYMHSWDRFPPPDNIQPVYVSVHIAESKMLKEKYVRDHFLKNAPIGCRDKKTLNLFLGWGIPAYYSGCLTITTERRPEINNTGKGEYLLVDNVDHPIPDNVVMALEKQFKQQFIRVSHNPPVADISFDQYVDEASLLMNSLLERYCKAALVITTKIHCALPCLAMGANVVLIHPNLNDPRIASVSEFMQIYSYEDVLRQDRLEKPRINRKRIESRKQFLSNIVVESVKAGYNIMKSPQDLKLKKIRRTSFIKASIYSRVISLWLKIGFYPPNLKRVYSLKSKGHD